MVQGSVLASSGGCGLWARGGSESGDPIKAWEKKQWDPFEGGHLTTSESQCPHLEPRVVIAPAS